MYVLEENTCYARVYSIHLMFFVWFFSVSSPNFTNSHLFNHNLCTLN